jgi:hypothetical protein
MLLPPSERKSGGFLPLSPLLAVHFTHLQKEEALWRL